MTAFSIGKYMTRDGREAVVTMVAHNCLLGRIGRVRTTWLHSGRHCAEDIEDGRDLLDTVPDAAALLAFAVELLRGVRTSLHVPDEAGPCVCSRCDHSRRVASFLNSLPPTI